MSSDEKSGSQRAIGRPRVPPGPLADLKALLYGLYQEAGAPRLDQVSKWAALARQDAMPGRDTVARIIGGAALPPSQADLVAVVTVLARAGRVDPEDAVQRARDLWVAARTAVPAGVPLAEAREDPFALEVHRPVEVDDAPAGLPPLPLYVPRAHDGPLAQVVRATAEGRSGVAVLVGGSSTGKTRACWEALDLLEGQGQWRLWHPIDPAPPEALLEGLAKVGPRTVIWLNEAHFYLDPPETGLGERVAAGLRELLRDPGRAPVLVLATLWPRFWEALATRPPSGPDPHAQARGLLSGHSITVPNAFTPAEFGELARPDDVRLALAARLAPDGEVAQFLAGAPELLDRYSNAPPAARAMITAAMDARRLGAGPGLPLAFLEAAAPGYLTDAEWDDLSDDWGKQALAYAAVPSKGARGPLTRIRPRPAVRSGALPGEGGSVCRLADYLDEHGRSSRAGQIPPPEFWAAAAAHASPEDQAMLGIAAHDRGLYRDAAQLHKNAAAAGIIRSAIYLARPPGCLAGDHSPAWWAATHADLRDPGAVALLLDRLLAAGAHEHATALAARDPAASVSLSNPGGVADLVSFLLEAGAHEQVASLAMRAASEDLGDLPGISDLAATLRRAGARSQAASLAARAVASEDLSDLTRVGDLVGTLRGAGEQRLAAALAARIAAHASLTNPAEVANLLFCLQEAGARKQADALIARNPGSHASLSDLGGVALLLGRLKHAGAHEQFAALAARAAAHADITNPDQVATLLGALQKADAREQAAALLARDPGARASLSDPDAVAKLLGALREMGANKQFAALADRAAAHASLSGPRRVAMLLGTLRSAGAGEQAATLLARDPASSVSLIDLGGVAELLGILRGGSHEQLAALLVPGSALISDPYGMAVLLASLRPTDGQKRFAAPDGLLEAGASEQFAALASRAAAHASLSDPRGVAALLDVLRESGASEQLAVLLARSPAAGADLSRDGATSLLGSLRRASAQQQAAALVGRLPAAGLFERFLNEGLEDRFRFGQDADGSPAPPWAWADLE